MGGNKKLSPDFEEYFKRQHNIQVFMNFVHNTDMDTGNAQAEREATSGGQTSSEATGFEENRTLRGQFFWRSQPADETSGENPRPPRGLASRVHPPADPFRLRQPAPRVNPFDFPQPQPVERPGGGYATRSNY